MTDKRFTPRAVDVPSRTPLEDDVFAALMGRLGLFEASPHVAVGVSGGADSMALAILTDTWVRARGGRMTALIVDHGLRPESAFEARDVKARLEGRGMDARILEWRGEKPKTGIQAAARAARFGLFGDWVRQHGVLHLLLGHHRDDQVETFLMRLDSKSGVDGLAGMAAVVERDGVRILRPFLHVPKVQLIATVTKRKLKWIEDPSNRNRLFARARVRDDLAGRDGPDPDSGKLVEIIRRTGILRMELERDTWALAARSVDLHPAGFAVLDAGALRAAPERLALRVLARTVQCIGGQAYAPRLEKTARLLESLLLKEPFAGRSLGGCSVLPRKAGAWTGRPLDGSDPGATILVCRENRGLPEPVAAIPGTEMRWDARFHLRLDPGSGNGGRACWIAPLGRDGWMQITRTDPDQRRGTLPAIVRPSLVALWDEEGVVQVPHLGFNRFNHNPAGGRPAVCLGKALFSPPQSLSGQGFCLA